MDSCLKPCALYENGIFYQQLYFAHKNFILCKILIFSNGAADKTKCWSFHSRAELKSLAALDDCFE